MVVAVAPTGPLAWKPSYAVGVALKKKKKKAKTCHVLKVFTPSVEPSNDSHPLALCAPHFFSLSFLWPSHAVA